MVVPVIRQITDGEHQYTVVYEYEGFDTVLAYSPTALPKSGLFYLEESP